jgi:prevent-host-death family protein
MPVLALGVMRLRTECIAAWPAWTVQLGRIRQIGQLGQVDYNSTMTQSRTLTSSEAKGSLGQVLGTLVSEGPVEITRNGRLVAVISAPPQQTRGPDAGRLATLAALYSAGKVAWRQIADETGASFGDVLLELAKRDLPLPRVTAEKRPAQLAHLKAVLRQASRR